jgi:hypothetical protein
VSTKPAGGEAAVIAFCDGGGGSSLPFCDASFDVVVCQQGSQLLPDRGRRPPRWSLRRHLHRQLPGVLAMLSDAREDLTAFASFPTSHWAKIWSTNPLERVNKEVKRRTNVVGILPMTPRCCAWPVRC